MAKKPRSRIVAAAGVAAASQNKGLARTIEQAMTKAAAAAQAKGITDPNQMRDAMLKAREAVKSRG